ncbi:unnamed protein product [Ectocarpus sp. CCAP 1310/34]|nr:unnamed protein product [Ectocarpus sp. CCAP 1310/34]
MPDSAPPICENCKPGKATDEREAAIEKMDCYVRCCRCLHGGSQRECGGLSNGMERLQSVP